MKKSGHHTGHHTLTGEPLASNLPAHVASAPVAAPPPAASAARPCYYRDLVYDDGCDAADDSVPVQQSGNSVVSQAPSRVWKKIQSTSAQNEEAR